MKFYIEELAKNNVISGYADGTFRPKENLTREQFAKMLSLAMELPLDSKAAAQFTDLADWSRPYVGALVNSEITYGKIKDIVRGEHFNYSPGNGSDVCKGDGIRRIRGAAGI
ncbi:S-layer homology domain-containing protein [Bacillus sp. ISL-45]|uniref:S-layer homology domain-containing protein n=1 Tax=Bacillus sp. ISL-45 TaxID=2819128 RepID=UPI001BEAAFBC|nr:S-layer homology domain-containing protein [Bacillus sp. ISL-45]MBT2661777.1 S-layer homology domain-containing protein [Bacillus sp. ISL-45]